METEAREALRQVAEAYAQATGLALTTVSKHLCNDGAWIGKFLAGELSPKLSTMDFTFAWFSERWPEGVRWPKGVKRPEAVSKSA